MEAKNGHILLQHESEFCETKRDSEIDTQYDLHLVDPSHFSNANWMLLFFFDH